MGPALSVRLTKSQIKGVKKGRDQLYRCPFYRGVCLIEVSVLQSCLSYRGVRFTELSVLLGCPFYRGVCLVGVSILQSCLSYRVSVLQRCLSYRVSVLQRCLSYWGVRFTELSVLLGCPFYRVVCLIVVSFKRGSTGFLKRFIAVSQQLCF